MRKMLYGLLAVLGLALAACGGATNDPNLQTAQQSAETVVFTLRTTYAASVLAPAAAYSQLPTCTSTVPQPCKNMDAVRAIQKADAAAEAALNAAEEIVRNHKNIDSTTAVQTAQKAVEVVLTVLQIYAVK